MRKLVLWGYDVDEYEKMFDLSAPTKATTWLEYGCGPSAVNAQCHEKGMSVVSCDPMFVLDKATLSTKVSLVFEDMLTELMNHQEKFDLEPYANLDALVARRRAGMAKFFADYDQGLSEKRYLPITSHTLPFDDFSFDMALSSHYLFADLPGQDVAFHLQAIRELARVAKEVRIAPLIDRYGQTSSILGPVLLGLQQEGYGVEVRDVNYSLQQKSNAMLRVWAQQCDLGVS